MKTAAEHLVDAYSTVDPNDFLDMMQMNSEHIVLEDYGMVAPHLTVRMPLAPKTFRHVFSWDADASEHVPYELRNDN
jgi:hypothetical protein